MPSKDTVSRSLGGTGILTSRLDLWIQAPELEAIEIYLPNTVTKTASSWTSIRQYFVTVYCDWHLEFGFPDSAVPYLISIMVQYTSRLTCSFPPEFMPEILENHVSNKP